MGEGELIKTQFSPLVISDLQLERKVDVDSLSRYRLAIRCQQQSLGWRGWYRRTQLVSFFLPMSVQFDGHKSPKDNNFAFARAVTCNDRTGLITVYLLLSFYFFFCVCDRRLGPTRIDSRRTRTSFGRKKKGPAKEEQAGTRANKESIDWGCVRDAPYGWIDAMRRTEENDKELSMNLNKKISPLHLWNKRARGGAAAETGQRWSSRAIRWRQRRTREAY